MGIKANINKQGLIKLKSFCIVKETLSKVKIQPSDWEKIIANEATDKGLFKKWAKQLNRHFSKEDIQMANKHMKR